MTKDPNKPRGKTSSYAFFVATCREEHKKKHPGTSVNFAEFSKKCSERWKVSCFKLIRDQVLKAVWKTKQCFLYRPCQPRRR